MDGKNEVLEKMCLKTLGRKCVTVENVGDIIPVLVERLSGDRTYAIAKWNEEIGEYAVIYDPCLDGPILKIVNGYAQKCETNTKE